MKDNREVMYVLSILGIVPTIAGIIVFLTFTPPFGIAPNPYDDHGACSRKCDSVGLSVCGFEKGAYCACDANNKSISPDQWLYINFDYTVSDLYEGGENLLRINGRCQRPEALDNKCQEQCKNYGGCYEYLGELGWMYSPKDVESTKCNDGTLITCCTVQLTIKEYLDEDFIDVSPGYTRCVIGGNITKLDNETTIIMTENESIRCNRNQYGPPIPEGCFDTDGGLNYYVKGAAAGNYSDNISDEPFIRIREGNIVKSINPYSVYHDYCENGTHLKEAYCENGTLKYATHECEIRCINYAATCEGEGICIDSDYGGTYAKYREGYVYSNTNEFGEKKIYDCCTNDTSSTRHVDPMTVMNCSTSGSGLYEADCNPNKTASYLFYDCKCRHNSCVQYS